MSYPKLTVNLRPTRGFISDTPAHEVGPDFWTRCNNVVMRGGFAQRLGPSRDAYGTALTAAGPSDLVHTINAEVSGTNYWLVFDDAGDAWAVEGSNQTKIDSSLLASVSDPEAFSSTRLNSVPVISNGSDEPVYWAGSNLTNLTDWAATESCQFIAAFKYHLFALDISGPGGTFNSLIKWSDAAAPGTIPSSWTPGPSNQAGSVELSDSPGALLCAYPLRDSLMIYKRSAMYQCRYVENNSVFVFRKLQATSGALTRRGVCDVNGQHLVVSDGDIVLTDGTNRRSLGEARVKDWFFDQLDSDNYLQTFCVYNPAQSEVTIGFPASGSALCNKALVYNVEMDSFGVRELSQVAHASTGVVNDDTSSNVWNDQNYTWDNASGAWNDTAFETGRDNLVLLTAGSLKQQDAGSAETISATLGKYSMPLDDAARVKLVKRVHVRAEGSFGTLLVRVGGQMSPSDSITWSPTVSVTEPGQIANVIAQGRYLSVEVSSSGSEVWKLTGLDLEVEPRGYF